MALTDDDIDKIVRLARLKPTAEEKRRLLSDLNKILEYMEIINEIDIESIEEMSHTVLRETPFREDIARPGLSQKDAILNAPQSQNGLFVVPKIIDNPDSSK
jgi:aspartyl-tRNA(Asn)/glutamyl-tRNA(Gln) amidotransferase subunit C